ncbi:MAG: GNAT family N-acetyltransferase [Aristaeellaceae bacterium]
MVRWATEADIPRINVLRKQVSDLHVQGRPDVFHGFSQALADRAGELIRREDAGIAVCEREGVIEGFASILYVDKPASPYRHPQHFLHIEEFGVDEACRRKGVGRELMDWIRREATEKGFPRIELDMWTFNEGALAFYEAVGFKVYRKYMEMFTEDA